MNKKDDFIMIIVETKCNWDTQITDVRILGIDGSTGAYETKARIQVPRFGKFEKELCQTLDTAKWSDLRKGILIYHLDELPETKKLLSDLNEFYNQKKLVFFTDEEDISVLHYDGEECNHAGCRNHISHPCEGCGRIGARGVVYKGLELE
jgi:hypothetical protein